MTLTMHDPPRKVELLAPAGTIEAGLAAYDCGADAVYFGLPKFNARERAPNFTVDEAAKLVTYARRTGRRAYVTLNTLVKQAELGDVARLLSDLYLLRPHAVIVQDLGVIRMLREHFPALDIHASTQMGTHNSAGIQFLARLGVKRVILERQVTLSELEAILSVAALDVEVFVHGALCCASSGSCLFSSWLGGWSGNRGKCTQPCRRRFYSSDGNGFFFSTKDLCLLDLVPKLAQMGVSAFKLEGRLRGADYVRHTVSAYRRMLDAAPGTEADALKDARRSLAKSLGRKWSRGFTDSSGCTDVIQHSSPGVSGLLCGDIQRAAGSGFEVNVSRPIAVGDKVRVQSRSGEDGPGFVVTRMSVGRRSVREVHQGETCFIHCDKDISGCTMVFKVGEATPDLSARIGGLHTCEATVDLDIEVCRSGLSVRVVNPGSEPEPPPQPMANGSGTSPAPRSALRWTQSGAVDEAKSRPLTPDVVASEFRRPGAGRLMAGEISVTVAPGLFIPGSRLKALRKAFWAWADATVSGAALRESRARALRTLLAQLDVSLPPTDSVVRTTTRVRCGSVNPVRDSLTCRALGDPAPDADEIVLPDFCTEHELPDLRAQLLQAVERGARRFRVTSLYALELLAELPDITLTASFPLPVANGFALAELREHGVIRATAWVELERNAIEALVRIGGASVEMLAYGRPPLLCTRAHLPVTGEVRNDRGSTFLVEREGEWTRLFPDTVLELPRISGVSTYIDLFSAAPAEPRKSTFNFDRELA